MCWHRSVLAATGVARACSSSTEATAKGGPTRVSRRAARQFRRAKLHAHRKQWRGKPDVCVRMPRQAKAGLIWIIGQYAERIENSQVQSQCRACVCRATSAAQT